MCVCAGNEETDLSDRKARRARMLDVKPKQAKTNAKGFVRLPSTLSIQQVHHTVNSYSLRYWESGTTMLEALDYGKWE